MRAIRNSLVLAACFWAGALAADPLRLPQSDGSELLLPAPAQRIVSLAPNLTEMAFAAGAGSRLLATVDYSDYPEAARALPRIGDAFRFDLERIMALQPDLVLAWTTGNPAAAQARLASLGMNVWRIEMSRPADIPVTLREMARAAGVSEPPLAAEMEQRIRLLGERYRDSMPVRYFYQVAERPLFTLNDAHIVSHGLSLCGGVNVFAGLAVIAPQVSIESVLSADPEVMFAPAITADDTPLAHWRSWPRLRAVSNAALYLLPADKISRATPRMLDSVELACTLLDRHRS